MQNYKYSNWNQYAILEEIEHYERELNRLRNELVSNYFSPDEIRGIIGNIREASRKLGERASSENWPLVVELTKKLEELTQMMLTKSTWDRCFGVNKDR